jgi:acyl-CoA thioesterase-1
LIIATRIISCRQQLLLRLLLFISLGLSIGSHADTEKNLLILGDSISAAYGMSLREGWGNQLQTRINEEQPGWQVVNASISGETSAGAAARLPALLNQHTPQLVIIELGGNDGLRGYPIKRLRENLQQMIEHSQAAGAEVLLLGMEIPPNYGARYTQMFRDTYPRLAESHSVSLVPFFLDNVATNPALMQADGIHPKVEAQYMLLDNVWPYLSPLLSTTDES